MRFEDDRGELFCEFLRSVEAASSLNVEEYLLVGLGNDRRDSDASEGEVEGGAEFASASVWVERFGGDANAEGLLCRVDDLCVEDEDAADLDGFLEADVVKGDEPGAIFAAVDVGTGPGKFLRFRH